MKILKLTLYVLAGIIALFLVVALFLPSDYRVERTISIEKPVSTVYNQVIDLRNWENWNPWTAMDPDANSVISGPGKGVGSKWAWEGKVLGTGYLNILEAEENKSIKSDLIFLEPQAMKSFDVWEFRPSGNGTQVVWANVGELDYPVGRYFGLFLDQMMGPDFEKGLKNLKQTCESMVPDTMSAETM
ncbi:MAG: SRPBCC family protein [Calditrichaceae bacterium]